LSSASEPGETSIESTLALRQKTQVLRNAFVPTFFAGSDCWSAFRKVPSRGPEFGPDIRTIPIGRYIVLLRVAGSKVTVLRIVHGARDLPRLFKSSR